MLPDAMMRLSTRRFHKVQTQTETKKIFFKKINPDPRFKSRRGRGKPLHTVKGGFKSKNTEEFFRCQNKCSKSLSWADNLSKLFTVLGVKFKFSAQDSDLEYSFWQ